MLASAADAKTRPLVALNSALVDRRRVRRARGRRDARSRPVHVLFLQSGAGVARRRALAHARRGRHGQPRARRRAPRRRHARHGPDERGDRDPRRPRRRARPRAASRTCPTQSFVFSAVLARQDAQSRLGLYAVALGARARARRGREPTRRRGRRARAGRPVRRRAARSTPITTRPSITPRRARTSRELFKGILDERAHGVFHGRIHVRPTRRRSTRTRPTARSCSRTARRSTASRSSRSTPTT